MGKAGRPGSYLGSWTGGTGGCVGLDGHGMEQEERFVSTVMPCFHKTTNTGTNFSSTAKVCSELVTAEMRMVAYPRVTSPPCSVKASPGAHEANKAPVTTTDLGSDESRRSRSSFGFDTAEDNSFMDVEDLICQRPEMVMESEHREPFSHP